MQKQIIISGASGNLGQEVVKKLTALGYGLHAPSRQQGLSKLSELPNVKGQVVDLSDAADTDRFVKNTIKETGGVQAGIFLAGGYAPGKISDTSDADLEKMFSTNFLTSFHLVKPLMEHFEAAGGGQFIFIGARPALVAEQGAGNFAYALSKSLLFKMAEFINAEGKTKNITATVIVPSTIDTPDNRAAMPDADFAKWIPASDMAEGIAFVLSETGQKMRQTVLKLYNNG
ncbi:SDR family NAD(P)-dependent oxidoreductase [Dyadobacter bucti]|uniref:SDR family NAD(P)-dependent oxidoreductase n=1 Tax=Dyadobacter bucti TaxID=2572203 RepID=UPI003F6E93D2